SHTLTFPFTRDQASKLQNCSTPALLSSSMTVLARCDAAVAGDFLVARVGGELRGREHFITPEGFAAALIQIYTETTGEQIAFSILKADGSEIPLVTTLSSEPHAIRGNYPQFICMETQSLSGDEPIPTVTALIGCYPNPFITNVNIAYEIEKSTTPVAIGIYNLKGQLIKSLVNENHAKGSYQIYWDGRDSHNRKVASGVYYISMNAGNYRKTMKVLITK
ncbi:MAG: FlgD immunoglobulin-like domain containing protein, partial [Candidatus Cloacimonetes bacterium]|nr:FlgD immunoglobulin-like domain containing protein [Candidatus Cloacimonadota bacterium]